jgi:hypothetical protein
MATGGQGSRHPHRVSSALRVSSRPIPGWCLSRAGAVRAVERRQHQTHPHVGRLCERVEEGLCSFQIGRGEPFGEAVVDRLEKRQAIRGTALIGPQPGKARCGAQFPGQRTWPARPIERLPEMILGRRRRSKCALQQEELALDAQELGDYPAFFGSLGPCQPLLRFPAKVSLQCTRQSAANFQVFSPRPKDSVEVAA